MPATAFELLYESFVRRQVVDQLDEEKRNKINAILANAAYLQGGDEGLKSRNDEIEAITEAFNEMVDNILDPVPEVDLSENQFFAAGMHGLEKIKWEYMGRNEQAAQAAAAAQAAEAVPA